MKSIWVPGSAHLHRPKKIQMVVLWTLWTVTVVLLVLWLWGMASHHLMGGWVHVLLAGAVVMTGVCSYYGFKYCEYLEQPIIKKIRGLKQRR